VPESKPYRSIDFNDERKWKTTHLLDDVLQVGKQKAIGYVVDYTKYSTKEFDMQTIANQLSSQGKLIRIVDLNEMKLLWVGDKQMIKSILNKNASLTSNNGWPLDAEQFFNRIAVEDIDHTDNPEMYHVVCDLFNSWCLWCEKPIWKKFVDGSTRAISANPYDPDSK